MSDFVRIFRFLARFSRDIPWARAIIALVISAGVLGGLTTTGLLAVINSNLASSAGGDVSELGGLGVDWRLYAGLCVAMVAFSLLSDLLLVRLGQRAVHRLRLSLARRVLDQPLARLEELGPERLLATLTNDVVVLTDAFSTLPSLCLNLTIVLSCLAYMFYLSPPAAAALLGFMVVGVVSYQIPVLRGLGYKLRARAKTDDLYHYLRALTEGAKELKLSGRRRDTFVDRDLAAVSDELRALHQTGDTIFAAVASWGRVLFFIAIGLCLFVAPTLFGIDTVTVLAFSTALILMISPLDLILASLPRLGNAEASARKIEDIGLTLKESPGETPWHRLPAPHDTWSSLRLEGVGYTYPERDDGRPFGLGPIDLDFRPGELVFLVGGNGSGKTTLGKILLGLYAPHQGRIVFDGDAVDDGNRDRYRQHFSVVFSDCFLFHRLLAAEGVDVDAEAALRLEELQLQGKVEVRDGELTTVDLSNGQRKRLALLHALLEDRPCCVFDEWAAEQDPFFRRIFYERILPRLKTAGKTLFVISHDDHYFHLADRIVKLDYGTVDFDGSPDLLAQASPLLATADAQLATPST